MIKAIVAVDDEYGIGKDGKLPWWNPDDLAHFKSTTLGANNLMGRKTWESLNCKALPNRCNMVLSSKRPKGDCIWFESIEDFLDYDTNADTFVIGGATVYKALEDNIDEWIVSHIAGTHDADTFLPIDLENDYHEVSSFEYSSFDVIKYRHK